MMSVNEREKAPSMIHRALVQSTSTFSTVPEIARDENYFKVGSRVIYIANAIRSPLLVPSNRGHECREKIGSRPTYLSLSRYITMTDLSRKVHSIVL